MYLTTTECTFVFSDVLKHSRKNNTAKPLIFRTFDQDHQLCPVLAISHYLTFRLNHTGDEELFVTTTMPYKRASPDTIARWIKQTMRESGIDTDRFTAHSCRSASTSMAEKRGISLSTIIRSAGWSNDTTFKRFYKKEIANYYPKQTDNFGSQLLLSL